jgi:uncharacterized protein YdiU (UPF0061 family)
MEKDLIAQFVENLIKQAGLDSVPENFRAEYTEKIAMEAQKRVGLIALKELDKEALDEFADLMKDQPDTKEMNIFFAEHIPNLEDKVAVGLREFAEEFLTSAEKLKQE